MKAATSEATLASGNPAADAAAAPAPRRESPGVVKRSPGAFNVDPRTITTREGWNVRFDMGDVEELANQIEAVYKRDNATGGLLHPLGLKRIPESDPLSQDGKFLFEVIRGARRTAALGVLLKRGLEFPNGVMATLLDKHLDVTSAIVEMFVENSGKPLLPLEEAAAFKRLRDGDPEHEVKGMTIKQICAAVGRKQPHVTEMLALLDADDSVKDALKDGSLGKTMAKQIASKAKGNKAKQKELVAAAKTAGKAKGGKAAVKRAIDDQRRANAAKKGRALKMRALSDQELSELGAKVASDMATKLKDAGKPLDFDVHAWVKQDDALALAYTLGALDALKASAGMKIDLSI